MARSLAALFRVRVPLLLLRENNMNQPIQSRILFVGAGFSANFDGYLTTQLWEHIYNQPDISKSRLIQSEMRDLYNVEDIPDRLKGEPRKAFMRAVKVAFAQHESILDRNLLNPSAGFQSQRLKEWIRLFAGTQDEPGFIFSLNVDLLLEKLSHRSFNLTLPALPDDLQPARIPETDIEKKLLDKAVLKCREIDRPHVGELNLIKLHGSINWRTLEGQGKRRLLVFGSQKSKTLKRWPLLSANFNLLKHTLASNWVSQVWIVGYGFGDSHINEALFNACERNRSLGLYVIAGATRPDTFFSHLRGKMPLRQFYSISNHIKAVITNSFSGIFRQAEGGGDSIPLQEIKQLMGVPIQR